MPIPLREAVEVGCGLELDIEHSDIRDLHQIEVAPSGERPRSRAAHLDSFEADVAASGSVHGMRMHDTPFQVVRPAVKQFNGSVPLHSVNEVPGVHASLMVATRRDGWDEAGSDRPFRQRNRERSDRSDH